MQRWLARNLGVWASNLTWSVKCCAICSEKVALDATPSGELIYQSPTGCAYTAVTLLRSATRVFDILRSRDARCPGTEALESLAEQLQAGQADEQALLQHALLRGIHTYALTKPITNSRMRSDAAIGVRWRRTRLMIQHGC